MTPELQVRIERMLNSGTSDGAHKGWATRRGNTGALFKAGPPIEWRWRSHFASMASKAADDERDPDKSRQLHADAEDAHRRAVRALLESPDQGPEIQRRLGYHQGMASHHLQARQGGSHTPSAWATSMAASHRVGNTAKSPKFAPTLASGGLLSLFRGKDSPEGGKIANVGTAAGVVKAWITRHTAQFSPAATTPGFADRLGGKSHWEAVQAKDHEIAARHGAHFTVQGQRAVGIVGADKADAYMRDMRANGWKESHRGLRGDGAVQIHMEPSYENRATADDVVANAGSSEGVRKAWVTRKSGDTLSAFVQHAKNAGAPFQHHGQTAAEVTGGKYEKSQRLASSVFHTVRHANPEKAASDFRNFLDSDGAQGAKNVQEPKYHNLTGGMRVSYQDDDNLYHHVLFKRTHKTSNSAAPDETLANAGTSEGVKKGWESRKHGVSTEGEKIIASALRINGHYYSGEMHGDAAQKAMDFEFPGVSGDDMDDAIAKQPHKMKLDWTGYKTSTGRYVDRKEGLKIAQQQKQLRQGEGSTARGELLSEDLSINNSGTSEGAKKGWETKHQVNGINLQENPNSPGAPGKKSLVGGKKWTSRDGQMSRHEIEIHPDYSPYSGDPTGKYYAEVMFPSMDGTFKRSGTRLSLDGAKQTATEMHQRMHGVKNATNIWLGPDKKVGNTPFSATMFSRKKVQNDAGGGSGGGGAAGGSGGSSSGAAAPTAPMTGRLESLSPKPTLGGYAQGASQGKARTPSNKQPFRLGTARPLRRKVGGDPFVNRNGKRADEWVQPMGKAEADYAQAMR